LGILPLRTDRQRYLALCVDHPVPRDTAALGELTQSVSHASGSARQAGVPGDVAVGGHFAAGNQGDDLPDTLIESGFVVIHCSFRQIVRKSILKVRRTHKQLFSLVFSLLVFVGSACADRLYTTDGESIPGTLLGIESGNVRWLSQVLGELEIEQFYVDRIESGDHFDFKLSGRELNNCWMFVQREQQLLHCDEGVETLSSWKLVVAVGEAVNDPPPILTQKGNLNVAAEDSSGNNDLSKINIDARSEMRFIESRHTLALRYQEERLEQETARDMWRGAYQYDQFFTEQWFVAGNASYEEDEFKDIDQRTLAGVGMGYQFLETTYVDLLAKGTVNYVDEKFALANDRVTPAFLWNLDFAWRFNDKGMEFFHRQAMLQAFQSSQDYEISTLTGFKYPINGHFSSTIQLQYDYDNLPAQDNIEKKDETWSIGVNYSW